MLFTIVLATVLSICPFLLFPKSGNCGFFLPLGSKSRSSIYLVNVEKSGAEFPSRLYSRSIPTSNGA